MKLRGLHERLDVLAELILGVLQLFLRVLHVLALGRERDAQTHLPARELAFRHIKQPLEQPVELFDAAVYALQDDLGPLIVLVQPIHHAVDLVEQARTPRGGLRQVLRRVDARLDLAAHRVDGAAEVHRQREQDVRHGASTLERNVV